MLEVILPFTVVLGPIYVLILASSICFVISPISFIDISVNMDKPSLTLGFILSPFSDVLGAVWPLLLPITVSEAAFPLP